jgi:hypothetical protein
MGRLVLNVLLSFAQSAFVEFLTSWRTAAKALSPASTRTSASTTG